METYQQQSSKKAKYQSHEKEIDRLSNLPESLILHILTLMDTKYAVQTCVLSKLWKHLWTHLPSLNLDSQEFKRVDSFKKFITHVLRKRNPSALHSLWFHPRAKTDGLMSNRIINYALSHNVKELGLCNYMSIMTLRSCRLIKILPGLSCTFLRTLCISHVMLSNQNGGLHFISSCMNLENLFMLGCTVENENVFKISAPRLLNLKMFNFQCWRTIFPSSALSESKRRVVISSPRLALFHFEAMDLTGFYLEDCTTLEKVNICIQTRASTREQIKKQVSDLLDMCQDFFEVKSFTASMKASIKGQYPFESTAITIKHQNHEGLSITGTCNLYNDSAEFLADVIPSSILNMCTS